MKLTIIILAISLYVAFGEILFQWSKKYLAKEELMRARIIYLMIWPIACIIGFIMAILEIKADKIAKDIEDMLK